MDPSSLVEKVFIVCLVTCVCSFFLYSSHNDGMNQSVIVDGGPDAELENLYPAIVQCFSIIICGYTAGRLNLISRLESKGLNTFVSTFALPCVIFLSLAKLDLTCVDWMFLGSILLSKSIVFIGVLIITFCVSRPVNYGRPGIYAIFCTQSNDFAIGYPILAAIYSRTHPNYPSYLYLMAPISLAILNPIAFVLMEIERQKEAKIQSLESSGNATSVSESALVGSDDTTETRIGQERPIINGPDSTVTERMDNVDGDSTNTQCINVKVQVKLLGSVVKSIITNPIVFMTILGIIGNYFYPHLKFFTGILEVFGSTFSGTALFVLGLRMVGTVQKLKGDDLLVPGVLIAVKLLVLPLVTREVTSLIHPGANASESLDLSTFGFLYGTFPTAPAVFVFSTQYNIDVDLISSSMVACTFLSAPLMFISAKMTSLDASTPDKHFRELVNFAYDLGIAGILVGAWLILLFIVSKRISSVPHKVTLFLIGSQIVVCFGAVLQPVVVEGRSWTLFLQFSVLAFGVYSSRIWTSLLAVTLILLESRSLCFVLKLLPYYVLIGWGVPIILTAAVGLSGSLEYSIDGQNPYFVYGRAQAIITILVLLASFIITSGCLVLHQRHCRKQAKYLSLVKDVNARDMPDIESTRSNAGNCVVPRVLDIEELASPGGNGNTGCDSEWCTSNQCSEASREVCSATLREYRNTVASLPDDVEEPGDPQITRHVVLLLMNIISMFVACMLAIWTLVVSDEFSGIYVELSFLDVTLTIGQIFFTFAVFGLDAWSVVSPLVNRWRKLWYGDDSIPLPPIEELSFETTHVCHQFIAHHLAQCERDLSTSIRFRLVVYRSCFQGSTLVEWLTSHKLTKNRLDAVTYASHLLDGRVIRHVENRHHFSDSHLLYTFRP